MNPEEMNQVIAIRYTNHRGETSVRRILPRRVWFGATEWHPVPQWIMEAYDLDKKADRSFAIKDIKEIR